MIDLRLVRDDPVGVRRALERRRDPEILTALDRMTELDVRRRECIQEADAKKAERNVASKEVARRKQAGEDVSEVTGGLKTLSQAIKTLDEELRAIDDERSALHLRMPNLLLDDVPAGGPEANAIVRTWGEPVEPAHRRPHWEVGVEMGILDLPRGAKLTGSGFPVLVGEGARLSRALAGLMLDLHTREHGYTEVAVPYIVARDTMRATGQVPQLEGDMYRTDDDLFLIPTAEVPLTNLHRDEIMRAEDLPRAYTALTPCFRREAGAHGKETRGLTRVHQFDKVELVRLTAPDQSAAEHELLTGHVERVLQLLELPYRVVTLAAGDTGFASAKTYDLEVWAPGMQSWLEVSSSSTFTDFQSRRGNIRFRPEQGAKPEFVHTLNASGLAFPRTIIALLEVHQQPDGSVRLPSALAEYFGADRLAAQPAP